MRRKIQAFALACILCILLLFSGCHQKIVQYSYDQEYQNIVKIEVFRYHYYSDNSKKSEDYMSFITALDLEDGLALLEDIARLPCSKHWGDFPSESYGYIVLYISYANGEGEIVGSMNSDSVNTNGKRSLKGYYFDKKQWSEVITKYIDKELVPELLQFLE